MNLLPDQLYFGVHPSILIACADRLAAREEFDLDAFAAAIGAPSWEAEPVLHEMKAAGFVSLVASGNYLPEMKFKQLANSRVTLGIPRSEADKLVERVLAKAREINAKPYEFVCSVACIVVFGSYLGDKPVLGDIDLGVHIVERNRSPKDKQEFIRLLKSGKLFSPLNKTYAALRLRQPQKISIHDLQEVIELETPYKIIFGALPLEAAKGTR